MFALATSPDANNNVTSTPKDASLPLMAIDYGLRAMAVVEEPQRPSPCCACIAREAGPMGLTVDVTAIFVIPYMDCLLERVADEVVDGEDWSVFGCQPKRAAFPVITIYYLRL